jgi:maltose-binding protein MalE
LDGGCGDSLKKKTCSQHTQSNHSWFDKIISIQEAMISNNLADIDNAMELLNFQNAEEELAKDQDDDENKKNCNSTQKEKVNLGREKHIPNFTENVRSEK